MKITHDLKIDLARPEIVPPVAVVQGDTYTRAVKISLYANGEPWAPPADCTAAVGFLKPDGASGLYDKLPNGEVAATVDGSTVTAILAPEVTTCPGTVMASIVFYDESMDTLATFPFQVLVERNPAAGTPLSNNYYTLQNLDQINAAYNDLLVLLTAKLPQPEGSAKVGYYLRVAQVDAAGNVVALETVAAAPSGGSGGGAPGGSGFHGVVWDLVNVTSSNPAASIADGAPLVAVLTAAQGYTIGNVAVTMGGEMLTGVWNADTATVIIASVTGDMVISCAGVEQTGPVDTTAKIAQYGYELNTKGGYDASAKMCYTEFYPVSSGGVNYFFPCTSNNDWPSGAPKIQVFHQGEQVEYWTTDFGIYGESTIERQRNPLYSGVFDSVRFSLVSEHVDNSYAYNSATGDIYFAGKNTPYYGMANVDETMAGGGASTASELSFDDDYAMDYGVSMTALVTDDAATDSGDLDTAFAEVVEDAKNEWLTESNGNVDKIPLIIHTDQHSKFNKPLWDFISKIVDWYDVGKVVNLGDTANSYGGDLLSDSGLESYIKSMASVPYSKRIEIFGNHDTWGNNEDGTGRFTPQNYLHKYFRNIYARRFDNHGNFVTYDDNYNVKYVVVSGFAYDSEKGGYSHYLIPSATIDRIIDELEKADGYDVILLSHVPLTTVNFKSLNDLWSGRKAKSSGSVTDEYGVSHAFDFTNCDGELLCGLHGHEHDDGHTYIGELLDAWFDAYYTSPQSFQFVIVDRENRHLNIWKVDNTPQFENYQIPMDNPTE